MDPILLLPEEEDFIHNSVQSVEVDSKAQKPTPWAFQEIRAPCGKPSTGPIPIMPKSAIKGFTLLKNHCSFLYF
jgi:hypothetical protein